jgi:hypothetical protein
MENGFVSLMEVVKRTEGTVAKSSLKSMLKLEYLDILVLINNIVNAVTG